VTPSASCRSTCAPSIVKGRSATTTSTPPHPGPALPGAKAVDAAPLLRIEGLRRRISYHSSWASVSPLESIGAADFERLAPVPFSTICFRYRPDSLIGREDEASRLPKNSTGRMSPSWTPSTRPAKSSCRTLVCGVGFVIRVALANLRTEDADVDRVWEIIRARGRRAERFGGLSPDPSITRRESPVRRGRARALSPRSGTIDVWIPRLSGR